MRTTIRSDSTRVPPVTRTVAARLADHRGRLAGDRGLVDRGDALEISPSAGIRSPASHTTRSPLRSSGAGTAPRRRRRACAPRSSASGAGCRPGPCRGPRRPPRRSSRRAPSATARRDRPVEDARVRRPTRRSVTTVPIRTTNMTGFLIRTRGSSLRNESMSAAEDLRGRTAPRPGDAGAVERCGSVRMSDLDESQVAPCQKTTCRGLELLGDRAEGDGGEEGQRADEQDHADQEADEHRRPGRNVPGRSARLLGRERAGERQRRDHQATGRAACRPRLR